MQAGEGAKCKLSETGRKLKNQLYLLNGKGGTKLNWEMLRITQTGTRRERHTAKREDATQNCGGATDINTQKDNKGHGSTRGTQLARIIVTRQGKLD